MADVSRQSQGPKVQGRHGSLGYFISVPGSWYILQYVLFNTVRSKALRLQRLAASHVRFAGQADRLHGNSRCEHPHSIHSPWSTWYQTPGFIDVRCLTYIHLVYSYIVVVNPARNSC